MAPKSEMKVIQRPQIKAKGAKNFRLSDCSKDILRSDGSSHILKKLILSLGKLDNHLKHIIEI